MFKKLTRQEKSALSCKAFAKYAEDDSMVAVFDDEKDRDAWVNDDGAFFDRIALTFLDVWRGADGKMDVVSFEDDIIDDNIKWLTVPHKMEFDGLAV